MGKRFLNGLAIGGGVVVALVIGVAICVAADIFTVDRNGVVRFGISDSGKVTLNTAEAAEGDMRFTSRAANPTAPLAGDLWYNNATGAFMGRDTVGPVRLGGGPLPWASEYTDVSTTLPANTYISLGSSSVTVSRPCRLSIFGDMTIRPDATPTGWVAFNLKAINGATVLSINPNYHHTSSGNYVSWATQGIIDLPSAGTWDIRIEMYSFSSSCDTHVWKYGAHVLD